MKKLGFKFGFIIKKKKKKGQAGGAGKCFNAADEAPKLKVKLSRAANEQELRLTVLAKTR